MDVFSGFLSPILMMSSIVTLSRHVIPKQPTVSVQDFEESITVFVAPELKTTAGIVRLPLSVHHVGFFVCDLTPPFVKPWSLQRSLASRVTSLP
jgi:hypothetical protein